MKKILLDVCCSPCLIPAIKTLEKDFPDHEIILYTNNSNIWPEEECTKRLESISKASNHFKKNLIIAKYSPEQWSEFTKGLEKYPENSKRCLKCYEFRLSRAASYAAASRIPIFCTTLTSGPMKNPEKINPIGESQAKIRGLKFLAMDFRKSGSESAKSSKELGLYRQNYCGCKFSIR